MNGEWHEQVQRYVDGQASAEEARALQSALNDDAALRAIFLDYMNLDVALSAAADATAGEDSSRHEVRVVSPSRFRWWPLAAAAACLVLAFGAGLLPRRKLAPPRMDLTAAMESAHHAIAQMSVPAESSVPEWMSPTASLLDSDLSRPPTIHLQHQP